VRREQHLNALGVDLHSCLHFLLEHYAQLLEPQVPNHQAKHIILCNLRKLFQSGTQVVVQVEVVRSVLMLSDVFTERSQYEWMLHKFLELTRTHPTEDELMQQLLTLGVCKAVALLSPVSHVSTFSSTASSFFQ
jgi:huntingtin